MSSFSPKEQMTMFSPSIAAYLSVNEAIVIHHIQSWCNYNRRAGVNKRDGYFWTYDTIEAMHNKYFPFIHKNTIGNILNKLEKSGIVVSANYNGTAFDRTKWYRIDEQKLSELEPEIEKNNENFEPEPLHNDVEMDCQTAVVTIPSSNSLSTIIADSENLESCANAESLVESEDSANCSPSPLATEERNFKGDALKLINYYTEQMYPEHESRKHPRIISRRMGFLVFTLSQYLKEYNLSQIECSQVFEHYLDSAIKSDHNIVHLLYPKVFDLQHMLWKKEQQSF